MKRAARRTFEKPILPHRRARTTCKSRRLCARFRQRNQNDETGFRSFARRSATVSEYPSSMSEAIFSSLKFAVPSQKLPSATEGTMSMKSTGLPSDGRRSAECDVLLAAVRIIIPVGKLHGLHDKRERRRREELLPNLVGIGLLVQQETV